MHCIGMISCQNIVLHSIEYKKYTNYFSQHTISLSVTFSNIQRVLYDLRYQTFWFVFSDSGQSTVPAWVVCPRVSPHPNIKNGRRTTFEELREFLQQWITLTTGDCKHNFQPDTRIIILNTRHRNNYSQYQTRIIILNTRHQDYYSQYQTPGLLFSIPDQNYH